MNLGSLYHGFEENKAQNINYSAAFCLVWPYRENESTDSFSETTNTISTLPELLIYSSLIHLIFKYYEYIIVTQLLGNTGDDGADILK